MLNSELFEKLLHEAAASERKRVNFDLRNGPEDQSQRMLNAMVPGTIVPIHRHRQTSETVVILCGRATEIFYDDDGVECSRVELNPLAGCHGVQVPKGQWHTLIVHEPTVIFESKDGAYAPQTAEDVWSGHS